MLLTREKAAHWYTSEGVPVHMIARSDGKGDRPTTVKDARKHGFIPSVTTILQLLEKSGLTSWKIEQAIYAALTLPRVDGETQDELARRIVADMEAQSDAAKGIGSVIHNAISTYLNTGALVDVYPQIMEPITHNIIDWRGESERVLVGDGYAGTCDFFGQTDEPGAWLVDFKTQSTKPGKKINVYDEWLYQLAAYDAALPGEKNYMIYVISTTEPGRIERVYYTLGDIVKGLKIFRHLKAIFYLTKNLEVVC